MITHKVQLSFSFYYPSAGYSVDVCSASASNELNVRSGKAVSAVSVLFFSVFELPFDELSHRLSLL